LGIGDWGLGPIPNPQSPIPNPQSPNILILIKLIKIEKNKNKLKYFRIIKLKFWCYLCYFGSACKSFL